MKRLFGTDGVRGVFGEELTKKLAYDLGKYGSYVLSKGKLNAKIVIGMDTRESGKPLEKALVDGITSAGYEVILAGVVPTPAIAVITRTLGADAGVVISASHNPYQFNGIKFFNGQGYKLSDQLEDEIQSHIEAQTELNISQEGVVTTLNDPSKIYVDFIKNIFQNSLTGLSIALDCANGAAYKIAKDYFSDLEAKTYIMGNHPDGKNINKECGSTHLDSLKALVLEEKCDIGFAFDGDADRCLAIDNNGEIIDGDAILNIISRDMQNQGKLNQDTVVVTVMSNIGLDVALKESGRKSEKTKVGDRYVLEKMQESNYNIGGEQSGHIILLDHNTTGDGLLSAAYLASILKKGSNTAAELNQLMKTYPQILVNAHVENSKKYDYLNDPIIQERIQSVEQHFQDNGRVLIRPSGTEPLVRVMIEGENQDELDLIAHDLAQLIENRLN